MAENAAAGDADNKKTEMQTSNQHFFKREQAAYGENEDAGRRERQATPQAYMETMTPKAGKADDHEREKDLAPETYMTKESA